MNPGQVFLVRCATKEIIKSEHIGPGDELFIIGHFRYHTGQYKNIPVVRVGNIAACPSEPLKTKSGPMKGYLIEARSIGGLSGSPVFTNLNPFRPIDGAIKLEAKTTKQHYLLGVMRGHYDEGREEFKNSSVDVEGVNVGIGIVTPL